MEKAGVMKRVIKSIYKIVKTSNKDSALGVHNNLCDWHKVEC